MGVQEPILEGLNLSKRFGGVAAIDDICCCLNRGDLLGLVGENGAGKSTLAKVLVGDHERDKGEIFYEGKEVFWTNPYEALISGVGLVHQRPSLVPELSAAENIFLGKEFTRNGLVNSRRILEEARKLLSEFPVNPEFDLSMKVREMSAGQREITEILKILSYRPSILILDEPTAGLTEEESKNLLSIIKRLNAEEQLSCIFISHRLEEVFDLCTEVDVLRNGKQVGRVEKADFDRNRIIHMIINRDLSEFYPEKSEAIGNCLLEAKSVTTDVLREVDIRVNGGEIIGLYGLSGAGMTEVVETLFGLRQIQKGSLFVGNRRIEQIKVGDLINRGTYLVPGDRDTRGLFAEFTVGENLTITHLNYLMRQFIIRRREEKLIANEAVKDFNIVCTDTNQEIHSLSGGNQQKVVIAKWLFRECNVLMLDDPTVGVDVGTKREVYLMLRNLTKKGKGVILVSSDILEIIGMSDRVYTMREGIVTAELSGKEINQKAILENVM